MCYSSVFMRCENQPFCSFGKFIWMCFLFSALFLPPDFRLQSPQLPNIYWLLHSIYKLVLSVRFPPDFSLLRWRLWKKYNPTAGNQRRVFETQTNCKEANEQQGKGLGCWQKSQKIHTNCSNKRWKETFHSSGDDKLKPGVNKHKYP